MWGWFWVAGIILAIVSAYFYRRRRAKRLMPESLFVVSFDSAGIRVSDPSGDTRAVAWERLSRVTIRTTDEGPLRPDVFWFLHESADTPSAVFPGGATGETELLAELQKRLSRFDNEQLIQAMASTSNALFVVWSGQS